MNVSKGMLCKYLWCYFESLLSLSDFNIINWYDNRVVIVLTN